MNRFRLGDLSSRDRLASSSPLQGKKQSHKLKSPRSSSSSEFNNNSCLCEALSENKQDFATSGVPMKSLLAQEMSKQKESKKRSPSIIARLMGLDVLPAQSSSHRQHKCVENHQQGRGGGGGGTSYDDGYNKSLRRSSKAEQKFKDVFEVLDAKRAESNRNFREHQGSVNANLTQAEMAFIRQKFMEAKRLSTDDKLRHSKEFNDALEALDSNKDLLLKFLQHPDSLFTKHLHDLHKPQYSQASSLKSPNSQKDDRDLLRKSHRSPHRHVGSGGCASRSHTRHASYDMIDLPNEELGKRSELQPTKIVVLKPNLGEPRYVGRTFASPSSSSDEFRADRRLPCTTNHGRQKSNEDVRLSRQNSRDSGEMAKTMSRQRKASCGNGSAMSFENSGFKGYAGDESSSGSDSASDSELVPVTSGKRTAFNRRNNYHRSLPSKSTTSSVSREAKRRLSERWKLTHKFEHEIEISRSGTLAEMLATSDREARPASFSGLSFEDGISKRFENNIQWSESPEPVGISSRDGWKGSCSRSFAKSKTIMNQESTSSYTIVLPKALINRDGLVKGNSSHHGESFLSCKSRPGSNKSHSSYNSSPEVNISPSLTKVLYMNDGVSTEKLSPFKACSSFSVDANSDSEDSSASDDNKTAMSEAARDLSTVTSVTDPDISRTTEDVNQSSVPEPQSRESSKEGEQPSPVSVLEASFDDDVSSGSECFESVSADLQGLRMQLQLLKLESATYNEGGMLVSSDGDTDQEESSTVTDETMITQELGEEDWKSLYLVDLLANSRFSELDENTVMTTPVDPSLFQDLEKKYSSVNTSTRLERKFLFDQISRELMQMLKQFSDPHPWVKPTRMYRKWDTNRIQETLRDLVTRKDEKPSKDDVVEKELQWLSLEDDIEIIGREIEEMLTDELITELVVGAIF
ncbi:PREDICTED: uncharacterized protein LOC104711921 isoform X1 [Camelina sativa]|uniref:Uncharacterized protein LOC104711921 isoform X1 n=1 Tax=Camelina sativa TaxID=90675 RepID=A0ABM1QDL9_CAMSA|nr:PREDICTED: uncharacterized protein LOC104711921 isoform X1 [Camelina sativa]